MFLIANYRQHYWLGDYMLLIANYWAMFFIALFFAFTKMWFVIYIFLLSSLLFTENSNVANFLSVYKLHNVCIYMCECCV